MNIDLAALPDDVDTLRCMISDLMAARDHERAEARAEIDRLRTLVKTLRRSQFGRRSERLSDVSAPGTDWVLFVREDFWLIEGTDVKRYVAL